MSTTPNVPYRLEFSVEVPGTPEQVWQAIATAKGMSAWFLPTEMEEREGGALHFTMGPEMGSEGHVTELGPAASHRLRRGLGRPHGQGPGCPEPAHLGVPRRGSVRRHLRRAGHQQRLRHRRRLGVGVLGRHGRQLDAVLRQPAPLPVALPRAGGHPARGHRFPPRRRGRGLVDPARRARAGRRGLSGRGARSHRHRRARRRATDAGPAHRTGAGDAHRLRPRRGRGEVHCGRARLPVLRGRG